MMEKRMINGHHHNQLDCNNNFPSPIESSFYKPPKPLPLSSPPLIPSPSTSPATAGGLEHPISKFDTLAGLAIKYGVEVADIKKLNGLVTDHQMFARKTLHIPLLPGSRSPDSVASHAPDNQGTNSSDQTSPSQNKSDFFDSFKLGSSSLLNVSPTMTTQRGYYGLDPEMEKSHFEGLEMAVYLKQGAHYPEDGPSALLNNHRKCKSAAFDLYAKSTPANHDEAKENGPDKLIEYILRSRKSEVDLRSKAPEMLLKEEVISTGGFSALVSKGSKGLALRQKSASRTVSGVDNGGGFPMALGNSAPAKTSSGVRRSASTPSFQDAENGTSSSSWWGLKPDLQALSNSSVTKPLFDGLAKPMTGKKCKAALD